jgi:GH18 family chitinase
LSGEQDWLLHSTDPGSDYTWAQWNDVGWGGGFVAALDRAQATGAHVVLSIGGWSLSAALREVFKSNKRDAFIDSVIDFLVRAQTGTKTNKKFAGVDIDWEPNGNMWTLPPAQSWNVTVSASDLQNYLDFLTALKQRMTQEKQKGTFENNYVRIAVTANPKVIKDVNTVHPGYWAAIANVVDSLNAMTYDYNGPWGALGTSGFNSPLFDDPAAPKEQQSLTIQETVATLISVGVPKNKFGIGTAAYARAYQLSSNDDTGPYQSWNGACTSFDDPNGVIVNRSIYRGINQSGTSSYGFNFLDTASFHTYPTAGPNYSIAWKGGVSTSGLQCLITFDDAASAARKMHYAVDQNLANFMLWEVSQDVRAGDTLVTGQPVDLTKHSVIYGLGHYTNYPK